MNRYKRNLVLDVYDYGGNKLCTLYDSSADVRGQATDVYVKTERNGWRELSFNLPSTCTDNGKEEENYRLQYLKADYRIRLVDDAGVDWFIISEPKVTHQAFSKNVSVIAGHVAQILKTKNLGLVFSDDEGNNVGTAAQLLDTILHGTGWTAGEVVTFYEKDGVTEKSRSLKAESKTGAFKLITQMCDLFDAKPVFHGDERTVDILPMNPFSKTQDGELPDVSKADGVVELHYGKNIRNVTRTLNTENIVTKLYAYGSYGDDAHGYCGIDECSHVEHVFTVEESLRAGVTYFFIVTDDADVSLFRNFVPTEDVPAGSKLVWSMLDPASMMYVWDETNELAYPVSIGERGTHMQASRETKEQQNWFSFVMDFTYYKTVGLLTDEMLQTLAKYQRQALSQYETVFDKSTAFADALTKLSEVIGSVDFCRLSVKNIDSHEGYARLSLNMDENKGVMYRSDYAVKDDDFFKWTAAEAINTKGDPTNDTASVIYVIHDTDPVTWDKVYIKSFDDKENISEITLWNGIETVNFDPVKDRFYLFGQENINGWLGALEISDEACETALGSLTKIVTTTHPVYFSETAPDIVESELNGYGWWWKYELRSPVVQGEPMGMPGMLHFCNLNEGDNSWAEVHFSKEQPFHVPEGSYWFNWAGSVLSKMTANGYVQVTGTENQKIVRQFGSVYRSCRTRDQLYQGVYQYYIYELTEALPAGKYYFQSDYDTKWVFTLTTDLARGDILRYNAEDGWMEQIKGGVQTTVEVKGYRFDNVGYTDADPNAIVIEEETYKLLSPTVRKGEIRGIIHYMSVFPDLADDAYLNAYATSKDAQTELSNIEAQMTSALGDLYREGWWQTSDYVDGDEKKLYEDALDNIKKISQPESSYQIGYLDMYSSNEGMEYGASSIAEQTHWPDLSIASAAHLVDPEIGVNAWAYLDVVKKCYDQPWKTSISINTNLTTMTQHSFTDVLSNIAKVASEVKGKTSLIDRATAITSGGQMAAERLQGAIDAAKLKIFGGASTWYTDEMGNMVFVSADGTAAMTLTGNGFSIANSKDEWGNWNWRTFGTGDGFSADEITTGYLSASRIEANSIGSGQLVKEVNDTLNEVPTLKTEVSEALIKLEPDNLSMAVTSSTKFQETLDDRLGYRLEIVSTSDILSSDIKQTTLRPRVYKGKDDVTDTIDESRFTWKRVSSDTAADQRWNKTHVGVKEITLTTVDVYYSATYTCELSDE